MSDEIDFDLIDWKEAERLLGHRVDHRRNYAREGKTVLEEIRYTNHCTGCFETGDYGSGAENYPWDEKAQCRVGAGCHECGYTGKVRHVDYAPYTICERQRKAAADRETPYV